MTVRYQRYQQATTHNAQYTPYCLSEFELRLTNIKLKSQVLLKVALQKIPPMVPATIKSTSKLNHVLAININRIIYRVHMPLLLYCILTIYSLVFLPQFCSVQTWQNTYSSNFHPIVFGPHIPPPEPHTDSEEELACNAPRTRIPRGRPKKERYRRGEARQHAPKSVSLYFCISVLLWSPWLLWLCCCVAVIC